MNHYLADAIREELSKLRARTESLGLPNSQSDSALNMPRIGSFLPDYLTGFRIPTANSPGGSSTSTSTTGSLQNAIRNMNFNQLGSSTTTQENNGDKEQEMETESVQSPSATTNPFQDNADEPKATENVSNSTIFSLSQEDFQAEVDASQFFGSQLSPSFVDSLREELNSPSKNVTNVNSDTFITQRTPSRLRRSGRLLSKKANLGIKVPSSKVKQAPKKSNKGSKVGKNQNQSLLGKLFNLGSQGLSQTLNFESPFGANKHKQTKRSPENSPEGAPPRKQSQTASRTEKQSDVSGVSPPKEQRSLPRSRTNRADQSRASATPTDVCKQTHVGLHVSTPRVSPKRGGSPTLEGTSPRLDDTTPWPSAHNLEEFTSNLSPVTKAHKHSTLNIKDILNETIDPSLANKLMNLPKRPSSTLDSSSNKSSEESISLDSIYPPKTVRGRGLASVPSLEKLTKNNSTIASKINTPVDQIKKLQELCDNTDFSANNGTIPNLQVSIPNNQKNTNKTVSFSDSPLPKLTNWDSYLKSFNTNPFSSNSCSVTSSISTGNTRKVTRKANSLIVTNSTNTTNIVSQQDLPREPIFEDAKSIWAQLRNALCRDVILRLRMKNLETMISDNLIPKWSVTYSPPSGLLTNKSQVLHVIQVRKQIFVQQAECTIYLTQREIDALQTRIQDLKKSLFALYQTPAGKEFNYEAALNGAIIAADKQRRQTFEELNKRLSAIRQNPEEALWMDIPDELRDEIQNPPATPEPQPSTSGEPQPGPSRARPEARSQAPRPQARSTSNNRNQGGQGKNQANQWVKVVSKRNKKNGKGKGQGKKSSNAPYNRNQPNQPRQPREPKDELYDLLADFFRKNPQFRGPQNRK